MEDSLEEKSIGHEEADRNELIEDEWTPDIEEMKKEAQFDENKDDRILDDLSV